MIIFEIRPVNPYAEEDWTVVTIEGGEEEAVASVMLASLLMTRFELREDE